MGQAADRAQCVCQGRAGSMFLPANVQKLDRNQIHSHAWKKGLKSLYYCRSLSIQRADAVSTVALKSDILNEEEYVVPLTAAPRGEMSTGDYEECLSCQ